jgi:exodeoxyribonuclease-5
MGGYAGTGKTTLLSVFATEADCLIAFVAFTGKASSVLSRKLQAAGIATTNKILTAKEKRDGADFGGRHFCGTIHSLIYRPCPCTEPRKKGEAPVKRPCEICHEKRFSLRTELDRAYDLIVVDEASMVSDDMLADIRRFDLPILAVGDHGQLPPVSGTGSLMQRPDIRLERIHRQAEGNPIIALSKAIRETGDYDTRFADGARVRFGSLRDIPREVEARFKRGMTRDALFDSALICYTNKRRVGLNGLARKARALRGPPAASELVVCLRNQKSFGVFNGMRGYLLADSAQVVPKDPNADPTPWLYRASIEFPEEGLAAQDFRMCGLQFNRDKTFKDPDEARDESGIEAYSWDMLGSLFDFGYAMTCHKSQGSGWPDVLVVSETFGMDREASMRWKYTAVTRSAERLTVLR